MFWLIVCYLISLLPTLLPQYLTGNSTFFPEFSLYREVLPKPPT